MDISEVSHATTDVTEIVSGKYSILSDYAPISPDYYKNTYQHSIIHKTVFTDQDTFFKEYNITRNPNYIFVLFFLMVFSILINAVGNATFYNYNSRVFVNLNIIFLIL